MWDDIFRYSNYYSRPLTSRRFSNFYQDLYRMMEEAIDEVAPKPEPKMEFKVVSTKTVKRNGNTYRVTVEKLSESETSEDDTPEIHIDESAEDFDEDTKQDMA